MNVALAEEIMALILMEPQKLDMTLFVANEDRYVGDWRVGDLREDCGTTACIAGWAALLTLPKEARLWPPGDPSYLIEDVEEDIDVYAARALGLDHEVAQTLFYDAEDEEAVPALKFLVGNPAATADQLKEFIREGRDPVW